MTVAFGDNACWLHGDVKIGPSPPQHLTRSSFDGIDAGNCMRFLGATTGLYEHACTILVEGEDGRNITSTNRQPGYKAVQSVSKEGNGFAIGISSSHRTLAHNRMNTQRRHISKAAMYSRLHWTALSIRNDYRYE